MHHVIKQIVDKTQNADIILLGEVHTHQHHALLECLAFRTLSTKGFDTVFLELDHHLINNISYVAGLPVSLDHYGKPFSDEEKSKIYSDMLFEIDENPSIDLENKRICMQESGNYNFISGLSGNQVSYQVLLKTAVNSFKHVLPVDYNTQINAIDPRHANGINLRNEYMAKEIARYTAQGCRGIYPVGGNHLESFSKKGLSITSLQSILSKQYGLNVVAIQMAGYECNLTKRLKQTKSSHLYPGIKHSFLQNNAVLHTSTQKSLAMPQHIIVFNENEIDTIAANYERKGNETLKEEFEREKAQWNTICNQYNCPELTV